jgi:hypothetical protein
LVAWGWAYLLHQLRHNDWSITKVTGASMSCAVHPDHTELVDVLIERYGGVAAGLERTVLPTAAEEFAPKRWAAHGHETDVEALGETADRTQLNERNTTEVEQPVLPAGSR